MNINIRVIDLELSYARALARSLQGKFPELNVSAVNIPSFVEDSKQQIYIDIFTKKQFPNYKPKNACIVLETEELSPDLRPLESLCLSRFSPLNLFCEAIENLILEKAPNFHFSGFTTSIISYQYDSYFLEKIIKNLINKRPFVHKFYLPIGPNFLFSRSENRNEFSLSELLLKISLKQTENLDIGKFLQINDSNFINLNTDTGGMIPFLLCQHPDDWLLISENIIREVIQTICSWLNKSFSNDWELYIVSIAMSQKANMVISSLTNNLYLDIDDNNYYTHKLIADLVGSIPKTASYQNIYPFRKSTAITEVI